MGDFKQLTVWQRSREVAVATYRIARSLPADERDVFADQMKRAAISISSNIAEGSGRQSDRDQARCYRIAMGSARELESLIIVADEIELIEKAAAGAAIGKLEEVEKMLHGLIKHCVRHEASERHRK
jgi:four helix bundle protein